MSTKRIANTLVPPIIDESKKGENDGCKAKVSLKDDTNVGLMYDMKGFSPEDIDIMEKNQKEFRVMKRILKENKKINSKYVNTLNNFDELKSAYDVICGILEIDQLQYEINRCRNLEALNKLFVKTRDQGK